MPGFRNIVLLLLPPIVVVAIRRLRARFATMNEWEAVPDSSEVWNTAGGWSHESIAAAQRRSWEHFISAAETKAAFGDPSKEMPGSAVDVGQHNNILSFAYVLVRAGRDRKNIRVLDWGGGVGQYYVYGRRLVPELDLDYVVKDVPSLCEVGRTLQPNVRFVSDDAEALSQRYDLVFASSSLQYSRDYYDALAGLCAAADRWLMITRSPFVKDVDDFVVVQRPHAYGYMTEYPAWFVNRRKFIAFVEAQGFSLDREFLVAERPFVPNAPEQGRYCGFLFRRSAPSPA